MAFPIISIPADAPDEIEAVGSKRKFWYFRTNPTTGLEEEWLFKAARTHTGEDWSEKIAAELCRLLHLPHATYELATWNNNPPWKGVISRRMEHKNERLVLGNELLAGHVNRYPRNKGHQYYQNPKYTLDLTLNVLNDPDLSIQTPARSQLPKDVSTAVEVFVGYLMLDAWIGNTDRHDNNWGILEQSTTEGATRTLAPTFDHASSLGRELRDEERHERLTTNDKNRTVQAYVSRCRSAFLHQEDDTRPMHPTNAFQHAAHHYPEAADMWLKQLEATSHTDLEPLFDKIPDTRISPVGIRFALRQLDLNRHALEDLTYP